ncbi:chromosome segregation protein SMC [uncultured Anaerococcus sp.]|uniref:chromosome segregation protein SMC n=1 Tax=uncultured Anaerococcus sp. TaxID=293428 RepID=UPI00288ABF6C|nr:chromosome segregation protein SMC [uncultured Anaerococcus sp.]
MKGFKSFANKTKIEFDDRITAVVGPNGSGKSNISDAIRWVLGEQSAKSLRGAKMNDVIFQGGENSKSLNLAEVNLNFSNEDKTLDLSYDKVKISRRIYRDGENDYRINGKKVRLKDVRELFLDTGVGKEGYSIISQGRIEQIISSSAKDRRTIFEEASGISKHKFRRDEASKKLEKVSEDLEIINRDWEFKKKDLKLLENYAKNIETYQKLTEDLDEKSYIYMTTKSDTLLNDRKLISDKIKIIEEDLLNSEQELKNIREKLKPYQDNYSRVEDEINLSKENITRYEKSIEKAENGLILSKQDLSYKQKDIDRIVENIKTNRDKKKGLEIDLATNKEKLSQIISKLKEIEEKIQINSLILKEDEEAGLKLKEDRTSKDLALVKISEEIYQYEIDKKSKEIIDRKNAEEEELRIQRLEDISKDIKVLEEEKTNLLGKIKDQETKIEKFEIDLRKNSENLAKDKETLENLINENNENNLKLKTSISEFKLQKENLDKNRGYFYSIQDFLNKTKEVGKNQLYLDSLANLIRVREGYEDVIDNLIGSGLQNIVTRSKKDTRELINFVNANKLGRITFLPIDSITSFRKERPNHPEVVAMAYDLVDASSNLNHIIDHFLGSTVVVKNIDDAVKLSDKIKGYRIITMNLDIINNWGSMVAGNDKNRKKNTNLLNRTKKLDELKGKILKLRNRKDELNQSYTSLLDKIKGLEEKLTDDRAKLTSDVDNYRSDKNKLDGLEIRLENYLTRKKELEDKGKNYFEEEKIFDIETLKEKREELNKDLAEMNGKLKDIEEEIKAMSNENIRLQSLSEITKRDKNLTINEITSIENNLKDLENSGRLENKLQAELDSSIDKIRSQDQKLRQTIEFSKKNLGLEKEKLIEKQKLKEKMLSENTSMISKEKTLDDKIKDLNIKKVKLDYSISSISDKYEAILDEIKSYISRPIEELKVAFGEKEPYKVSKANLIELQRKINAVGYFEEDSLEKYKTSKEEFDFLDKQLKDLINSKADIEKMIEKLEIDMKTEFIKNFELINGKFTRIFKTLFIGGDAKLILDSEDSLNAGIEIQARPPGKSLKSISLLSGGEKSLTAVALLFAIFETNPAPFAILDEIDAALDETNIKRYIEYLKGLSDKTQFIMITHRQTTMQLAERIHGVTIGDDGISKIYSIDFGEN